MSRTDQEMAQMIKLIGRDIKAATINRYTNVFKKIEESMLRKDTENMKKTLILYIKTCSHAKRASFNAKKWFLMQKEETLWVINDFHVILMQKH